MKNEDLKKLEKINGWIILDVPRFGRGIKCQCDNCKENVPTIRVVDKWDLLRGKTTSCGCRAQKNREKTNVENLGVDNPRKSEDVKKKIRKTTFDKFGVEHSSQSSVVREKRLETLAKNYGEGITNPSQSPIIRERIVTNNRAKFGTDYPTQNEEVKNKVRESMNARKLSTGEYLMVYLKENKISPTQAIYVYNKLGEEAFLTYCNNYHNKTRLSSLEVVFTNLMSDIFPKIKHYNETPLEIASKREFKYKPDFRLVLNNKVLYVNVDGLFWHSEEGLKRRVDPKNYHNDLYKMFSKNNLTLFQFRETEIRNNIEWVRQVILNYFDPEKYPIEFSKNYIDLRYQKIENEDLSNVIIDYEITDCYSIFSKDEELDHTKRKHYFKLYDAGKVFK